MISCWTLRFGKHFNLLEGLLVQFNPVGNTASHGPNVNIVKTVVGECPLLVDIVDLEFAVGRNKAGLDG